MERLWIENTAGVIFIGWQELGGVVLVSGCPSMMGCRVTTRERGS